MHVPNAYTVKGHLFIIKKFLNSSFKNCRTSLKYFRYSLMSPLSLMIITKQLSPDNKVILCTFIWQAVGRTWLSYRATVILIRKRGHWNVSYTSTERFFLTFSYSLALQLWGLLLDFNWFVNYVECSNVSIIDFESQMGWFCESSFGMYTNLSAIVLSL